MNMCSLKRPSVLDQTRRVNVSSATRSEALKTLQDTVNAGESKNTAGESPQLKSPHVEDSVTVPAAACSAPHVGSAHTRNAVNYIVPERGGEKAAAKTHKVSVVQANSDSFLPSSQHRKNNGPDRHASLKNDANYVPVDSPESPRPHSLNMVPKPIAHFAEGTYPPFLPGLDELIVEARLFTEHWHLFNDFQRKELARLVRKVAEARNMDKFNENSGGGRHYSALHSACAADSKRNDVGSPRVWSHLTGSPQARGTSYLESAHWRGAKKANLKRPLTVKETQVTGLAGKGERVLQKAAESGVSGVGEFPFSHDAPLRDAVARFAHSLGVHWPPKSQEELFFMTGARLTPQQRNEFYEALELQARASNKLYDGVKETFACGVGKNTKISKNEDDGDEKKIKEERCGQKKLTRKTPAPTRTSILRKAFALMDVGQKGVIHAGDLPALRRLLGTEREHLLELARGGAVVSSQVPVLSRARSERRLLTGAVDARRASVDAGFDIYLADPARLVTLYGFLLDVIFPILCSSGFVLFDFATVGFLVFGSMGLSETNATPNFLKWRHAALQYFELFK